VACITIEFWTSILLYSFTSADLSDLTATETCLHHSHDRDRSTTTIELHYEALTFGVSIKSGIILTVLYNTVHIEIDASYSGVFVGRDMRFAPLHIRHKGTTTLMIMKPDILVLQHEKTQQKFEEF
jgi:hypothetical protein